MSHKANLTWFYNIWAYFNLSLMTILQVKSLKTYLICLLPAIVVCSLYCSCSSSVHYTEILLEPQANYNYLVCFHTCFNVL